MTNEQEFTPISWDEVTRNNGGKYVKFESGKRVYLSITNWQVGKVIRKKYQSEEMEERIEFRCDVLGMGDKADKIEQVDMLIGNTSVRFIQAIKPILEHKENEQIVVVSVKKIGKDTDTNYDIEFVR